MKDKNLVHIMFEREEGIDGKKSLLQTQIGLLRIAGYLKKYHALRKKELQVRAKLSARIKRTSTNLKKIQATLPQIRIHKKDMIRHEINAEIPEQEIEYDSGIESQLREIQEKLNSLQR